MCGIVGMAGNLLKDDFKAFRDMLLMDVLRGQDSSGVLSVGWDKNSPVETHKDKGHPINLWDEFSLNPKVFDHRGVFRGQSKVLIGHNRAATQGAVTTDNAHPFTFGHIHGVHNGSLWSTHGLEGDYDVDSKEIFNTIYKKGIEHTWKNIDGAAALVWWDDNEKTLNMIRNNQRPLWVIECGKGAIYWASEAWTLDVAMGRNKIKAAESVDKVALKAKQLIPHKHYKFHVEYNKVKLLSSEVLEEYVLPKKNYVAGPYGGVSNYGYRTTVKKNLNPKSKINAGWAADLAKADKELRGLIVTPAYFVTEFGSVVNTSVDKDLKAIVCKFDDSSSRVKIFCKTEGQLEEYRESWLNPDYSVELKLKCRPRVKECGGGLQHYYISADYIEVVSRVLRKPLAKVDPLKDTAPKDNIIPISSLTKDGEHLIKGYGGAGISELRFEYDLSCAGNVCANCDQVLDKSDADSMLWLSRNCVVCEGCSNNPMISNLVNMN